MKSTFLSLFALAVAAVSAAPTLLSTMHPTPVSAACNGLAPGATDEVNNFKLAAFYTSKTNANATGVPLVVGQDGGGDGLEFKVLSVRAHPFVCAVQRRSSPSLRRHTRRTRTTSSPTSASSRAPCSRPVPARTTPWPTPPLLDRLSRSTSLRRGRLTGCSARR